MNSRELPLLSLIGIRKADPRASSTEDKAQGASRVPRLRNHDAITLDKGRKVPARLGKNKILLGEVDSNSATDGSEGSGASRVCRARVAGWELLRSLLGKL